MHIVTKFLVVIAAVLSVLLSALTIAYTYNADAVAHENSRLNQAVADRDAAIKGRDAEYSSAQQAWAEERAGLVSARNELEAARALALADNAKLRSQVREAQTQAQTLQSQIEQMTATEKTLALLIESYRSELTTLREGQLRSTEREIELADRINDLTGQLQVAQDNNRALQEQLAELQATISGGTIASRQGGAGPASSASVVQARVTSVTPDRRSGQTFAEIDAGSNDSVREGMSLNIIRDGAFLAKLIVTRVDLQKAVGRIDTLSRNVQIRPGDTVISALR